MWRKLRDVGGLRLGTLENLLTEKRAAIALADFMAESGLLDQFKDVDPGGNGDDGARRGIEPGSVL